jgi:ligand-binding SRPBCC domain-containing protein
MAIHTLRQKQYVHRPTDEVFAFFSSAENLDLLTPPHLRFVILTPTPIEMRPGTLIDYRLRWRGIPVRWRTRIEEWEPGRHFVDVQLKGPYRLWHHSHWFKPHNGGTMMTDIVRYALPLGPLGRIVHAAIVQRDVEMIFAYRRRRINELFADRSFELTPERPPRQ